MSENQICELIKNNLESSFIKVSFDSFIEYKSIIKLDSSLYEMIDEGFYVP